MNGVAVPHVSVLVEPVLELLRPGPDKLMLDGTAGAGGHAAALLEAGALVIALDQDPEALKLAAARLLPYGERCRLVRGNFSEARRLLDELKVAAVDGALLDLGMSSMQLDNPARGFSFRGEGPLDMRMGGAAAASPSAAELIASADESAIADALWAFGEERFAKSIARGIKRAPRMQTSGDLVAAVERAVPRGRWPRHIHVAHPHVPGHPHLGQPGARGAVEAFLRDPPALLAAGARAAVISFHSLEDRMVKDRFRELEGRCTCPPRLPTSAACGAGGSFRVLTLQAGRRRRGGGRGQPARPQRQAARRREAHAVTARRRVPYEPPTSSAAQDRASPVIRKLAMLATFALAGARPPAAGGRPHRGHRAGLRAGSPAGSRS